MKHKIYLEPSYKNLFRVSVNGGWFNSNGQYDSKIIKFYPYLYITERYPYFEDGEYFEQSKCREIMDNMKSLGFNCKAEPSFVIKTYY